MNNFNQKNIIYNLSGTSEIPYKSTNEVSLKSNQIIYTATNNSFQQLRDNDLFIERAILAKGNTSYVPLDETKLSSVSSISIPEGTKYWSGFGSDNLSLIRKEQNEISNTLSCIITGISCNAILNNNGNWLIGEISSTLDGSHNGHLLIENPLNKFTFTEVDNILKDKIVNCIFSYGNVTLYGTSEGIFSSSNGTIKKIDKTDDLNVTKISIIKAKDSTFENELFIGTISGLYECEINIDDNSIELTSDIRLDQVISSDEVAVFKNISSDSMLVGTKEGLYKSYPSFDFINFIKVADISGNAKILDAICYNGITLFGTDSGIYSLSTDEYDNKLISQRASGIYINRMYDFSLGNLLAATNTGLYSIGNDELYSNENLKLSSLNIGNSNITAAAHGTYDSNHEYIFASVYNSGIYHVYYANIAGIDSLASISNILDEILFDDGLQHIWKDSGISYNAKINDMIFNSGY